MTSAFGSAIEFMGRLGIYDVVLPFILTYAIVFAILEKTKVLGVEMIDKQAYSKRSLNSIVAFSIGFFVIASAPLVEIIQKGLSQVVILLLISVFYIMLIGSFMRDGDKDIFLQNGWKQGFMIAMLVGILLIFANAIPVNGKSLLVWLYEYVISGVNGGMVATIILLIVVIAVMFFITRQPETPEERKQRLKHKYGDGK